MNKQPEVTAATRQKLIDAFWKLYEHKRIEKISIREITDIAGYNRGTFYLYFADIYDLLNQLELSILPGKDDFDLAIHSLDQNINRAVFEMTEICSKNAKYYRVLLSEHGDPYFQNKIKHFIKSMLCEYLQQKNLYKESTETEYFLEYTVSAIVGIISYWLQESDQISLSQFTEIQSRILTISPLELLFQSQDNNQQITKRL